MLVRANVELSGDLVKNIERQLMESSVHPNVNEGWVELVFTNIATRTLVLRVDVRLEFKVVCSQYSDIAMITIRSRLSMFAVHDGGIKSIVSAPTLVAPHAALRTRRGKLKG